ncbi:hypothetical protein [Motilimonas eburnea]|uniref:hypothetical protein n=1 Tax=Motilimonas eburnea TaxID=1737488 RepID=UPI001E3A58B5|nr:hypothetical protein [Motilimonas eburnea]MCE2572137.1 hypothetical protein [Motilimonas eburnea]
MFSRGLQRNANKVLGVYLRPDSVALAIVEKKQVSQLLTFPVSSSEQWLAALSEQVAKLGCKKHLAFVVLSQHFYQQVQIERPNVPDEELLASLPFAIKELVSEPLRDLVLDYVNVPAVPMMAERLNVIYSPKAVIQRVVSAVSEAGLKLQHIGVEELTLANLLDAKDETQMLIYQHSADDVLISVVRNGALYFSRHLRGFQSLCQQTQVVDTFLLEGLGLELQRSLDYVVAQLKIADVNQIKLALPNEHVEQIARQIGESLGRNIQGVPLTDNPQECDVLPALAALPNVAQLNLMSTDTVEEAS